MKTMKTKLFSLLLLAALSAPAVIITLNAPPSGTPVENGTPQFFTFFIDNSDPGSPTAAHWILITSILFDVITPSLTSDFTYTDQVSGLVDGVPMFPPQLAIDVTIGPAGFGDQLFLTSFFLEPLLSAISGLNILQFQVNYDLFDVNPIDLNTLELDPNILAVGSGFAVITTEVDVVTTAVPEPSTWLTAMAALLLLRRKRRPS